MKIIKTQSGQSCPLSFRWVIAQGNLNYKPWYIVEDWQKKNFADNAFKLENIEKRSVLTFAYRQDQDDFAGFEIINGKVTENIIYFHPSFNNEKNKNLIIKEFHNFFKFMSDVIIPDMQEWCSEDDFEDILEENN